MNEWRCENCDLGYDDDGYDGPDTQEPYACDDCGGAVERIEDYE